MKAVYIDEINRSGPTEDRGRSCSVKPGWLVGWLVIGSSSKDHG
jgi:hypothetical protein